ncbi:CAP domain-containing protein [Cladorrhinum samala]|uniref:CAP domain-containing protein n=1 Tax=Cladorrhinum samala TaxID=585594 RepID=A0AAV9I030_9PEZI|nr:CAP domain-containing protein [Cladorrhinum samala]
MLISNSPFLVLLGLPFLASTGPVTSLFKRDSPPPTAPSFISFVLGTVNPIRAQHAAQPLVWDPTIAAFALSKANGCKLNHTGPYGENAYWSWYYPPTYEPDFNVEVQSAFESWTSPDEVNAYLSGNLLGGSHFTQTVWKASQRIGCAFSTRRCSQNPDEEWWFYCDFAPRGNYRGFYVGNVTV